MRYNWVQVSAEELNEIELLLSKSFGTLEVCGNMQNYYKVSSV